MTKLTYNPLSNSFDYVSSKDDFVGDFYPSSLGKQVSSQVAIAYASAQKALYDASVGDITHEQAEGWYYPSSLGKGVSSQVLSHINDLSLHSSSQAWSGSTEFYAVSATAFKSGVAEVNMLIDVDTQTTIPIRDYVLKWNGTAWTPAPYDYSFTFHFNSFSYSDSVDPRLIGSGSAGVPINWHNAGTLTFTATYNNGPPSSVAVWARTDDSSPWTSGWTNNGFDMLSSPTSKSITEGVRYPNEVGKTITFYLSANASGVRTVDTTFRNLRYYGQSNAGVIADSDLYSIASSGLTTTSNDRYSTFNVSPGVGEYAILAYPDSYGTMAEAGRFGYQRTAIDATHMTALFNLQDLNPHTNAGGYKENYNVYKSAVANLGLGQIKTTTTTVINQVKYGYNPSGSDFTEGFITNLVGGIVSNDEDLAATYSVSPTATHHVFLAVPSRFNVSEVDTGDRTLRYKRTGGLEATMSASRVWNTVSWTNPCGYAETYNIFSSKTVGLPAGTLGFGMARLNLINYGTTTTSTAWTSAEITGFQASSSTTDHTQSWSYQLTPGESDYVVFACPSRLTNLTVGTDYETNGNVGTAFTFSGLTAAFQAIENITVTNIYGYKEDYDVYRSTATNIGGGKGYLVTLDSAATTAYQYYGASTSDSAAAWTLADFEALTRTTGGGKSTSTSIISTPGIQFTVTTGFNEHMWFCYPKRLGSTIVFYVGGFAGGFEPKETVSLTNANGWTEDYYCWRSTQAELGSKSVETKTT